MYTTKINSFGTCGFPKALTNDRVQLLQHGLMSDDKTSTLAAVSLFPRRAYVVKVSIEIITGVVAQKYTHQASRYFLPFRLFNSAALEKLYGIKVNSPISHIFVAGTPTLRYRCQHSSLPDYLPTFGVFVGNIFGCLKQFCG